MIKSTEPFRTYSAYGLTVRSQIPLDEFPEASAVAGDVVVHYDDDNSWIASYQGRAETIEICGSEARFWFPDVGGFAVRDGRHIAATCRPDAPPALLRLYVQGMLLAMILHQRGMCVLHASVVEVDGKAIAMMGHVGAGKSSVAGALYAAGHRVLSDDNAAIQVSDGPPSVTPAYPFVKLFPAIASMLGFHNGALRQLHTSQSKMAGSVRNGFSAAPSPLSRIYILGRDHEPTVKRLTTLEATVELIRNAVPTRWGHPGNAGQLQLCGAVARQVPVFTLRTFADLAGLPQVAHALEQHCRA